MNHPHSFLFYSDLSSRGRLRLTGEDRVRFLNGQVTNNIKTLIRNMGCYAVFSNAKGKIISDVTILNTGDALFLDLEEGHDISIASNLEKFLIADNVTIENITKSWCVYTIIGESAACIIADTNLCDTPPAKIYEIRPLKTNLGLGSGFVYRSRRALEDSFDIWTEQIHRPALEKYLSKLAKDFGATIADTNALEILRIEAGIPRFGIEMDANYFPQEAGIEALAISYSKGCYLGQEVIARIKSVGRVHRTLVRLHLSPGAKQGDPLIFNDKEVGKLGSAVTSSRFGRIGLAIVRCEASMPNSILAVPSGQAEVVEKFNPPSI